MLKVKFLLLLLFFCNSIECQEIKSDIKLLVACGFIQEAKFKLITIAHNQSGSRENKIQALLLLDSIASSDTERQVILETLCDIDDRYLPRLKQVESDVQNKKVQQKLRQEELKAEKEAKLYLEYAKLWRRRIQEKEKGVENNKIENYYDYNELVESMEFCLSKALSLAPHSDVSREAFDFYFNILFQDLIGYKYGFFSAKLDAHSFELNMARIIDAIQIYETVYSDSPNVLKLIWDVQHVFYELAVSGTVPRNKKNIKPQDRHLIYYGSVFDFYMSSINWLDRIMEKSDDENFYSNMARRKYRLMQRSLPKKVIPGHILDDPYRSVPTSQRKNYDSDEGKPRAFFTVDEVDLKKMAEEINKRVSLYPVLKFKILEK